MKALESEIGRIIGSLREKGSVIKEFNFIEDIDKEKSNRSRYDANDSFMEFHYALSMDARLIHKETVLGDCIEEAGKITLIPTLNNEYKDQIKRAGLIFNSSIDPSIDMLAVKFVLTNELVNFYCILANDSFYHYITDKSPEKIMEHPADSYQLACCFNNKGCTVKERKGKNYISTSPVFIDMHEGENRYLLDLIRQKIKINNEKFRNFIKTESTQANYLYLAAVGEGTVTINEMEFGETKGYIYLKPVEVNASSVMLNMVYTGEVEVEYFNDEGKWEHISINENITSGSRLLHIRLLWKPAVKYFI